MRVTRLGAVLMYRFTVYTMQLYLICWTDQSLEHCDTPVSLCPLAFGMTTITTSHRTSDIWHLYETIHSPMSHTRLARVYAFRYTKKTHGRTCKDACFDVSLCVLPFSLILPPSIGVVYIHLAL